MHAVCPIKDSAQRLLQAFVSFPSLPPLFLYMLLLEGLSPSPILRKDTIPNRTFPLSPQPWLHTSKDATLARTSPPRRAHSQPSFLELNSSHAPWKAAALSSPLPSLGHHILETTNFLPSDLSHFPAPDIPRASRPCQFYPGMVCGLCLLHAVSITRPQLQAWSLAESLQ